MGRGGWPRLCPCSRDLCSISAAHSLLPLALNRNVHHQPQHVLHHQGVLSSSHLPMSYAFLQVCVWRTHLTLTDWSYLDKEANPLTELKIAQKTFPCLTCEHVLLCTKTEEAYGSSLGPPSIHWSEQGGNQDCVFHFLCGNPTRRGLCCPGKAPG